MKSIDLTGMKFGQLTALRRAENRESRSQWLWRCDCGKETLATSEHVKSGHTASCGCLWAKKCVRHGHGHDKNGKQTKTYKAWVNMRSRVNPDIDGYRANYADRGITVCDRWQKDFRNFLEDMGECPAGMSLDRYPDNDGSYEPDNCRWATPAQQNANRRCTRRVTVDGKPMLFLDACRLAGIHPATAQHRLNIGMTETEALCAPVRRRTKPTISHSADVLLRGSEWMMY